MYFTLALTETGILIESLKHDYIGVHSIFFKSPYVLNILEHNPITKGDSSNFNHVFTH